MNRKHWLAVIGIGLGLAMQGSNWIVPPGVLHAPGSLVTFEPQWASDVSAVYQSMVEGRYCPWELLVKDVPKKQVKNLNYLVDQLDWKGNIDPDFKEKYYMEPIVAKGSKRAGYIDRWIVYGKIQGQQLFTAKELSVEPGVKITLKDNGAYGLVAIQGSGSIGKHRLHSPSIIRFGELTDDEFFVSYNTAREGVVIENTGHEPLVTLRYFGPDANPEAPNIDGNKRDLNYT